MNKALFVLPLIFFSLLLAIWSGWGRIGWAFPQSPALIQHGALMVGSFLSSIIFLERAVTFKTSSLLALPLINALSGAFFLFGYHIAGYVLLISGSAGFLAMCFYFIVKHKELYYYIFFTGALCLLIGNILLLISASYGATVYWWMGFLLFTILAERLELSRFLKISPLSRALLLCSIGICFLSLFMENSLRTIFFSLGLVAISSWLLMNDMARHSIKIKGQHRYSGLLLITGYVWLFITAFFIAYPEKLEFNYDSLLHSFFIGFVFSMIFSHAPIILPAVLKKGIKPYHPILYLWFVLMQLSLVLRIAGNVTGELEVRKWGAMLNGISIVLFFMNVLYLLGRELRKTHQPSTSLAS